MPQKNPYKIDQAAEFSADERLQLANGEKLLKLLEIKQDPSTGKLLPGVASLGDANDSGIIYIKGRQVGNSIRRNHMRQTKSRLSRALELISNSLLGAGSNTYCADKWEAVFNTQMATPSAELVSAPHLFISLQDTNMGLALLRHTMDAGRLPPDWRDESGVTLLMRAAERNNMVAAQFLLEAGADPSLTREVKKDVLTAADVARRYTSEDVLMVLNAWAAKRAIDVVLGRQVNKPDARRG